MTIIKEKIRKVNGIIIGRKPKFLPYFIWVWFFKMHWYRGGKRLLKPQKGY